MSLTVVEFWKLVKESRLLDGQFCQQLSSEFSQVKGANEQMNARTLAEWLVGRNVLSRYQTTILLAGRAGPFHYGDYTVYDRVDKGRLAGQFRAVHGGTGHPVLLQFLTGPMVSDVSLWAVAAHDALAAAAIVSPHVMRVFEPVDLGSFKFLVTEDLRGSTVDERLAVGRFPASEACRIARLAAIGLAQMHQYGRAHGDLRPANILLESIPNHPGNVKLLYEPHQVPGAIDFAQSDSAGRLAAMADYLAPEMASPGRVPDVLTDIYALGCTLYTLLSGNPPFAGGNLQQKVSRHATEPIRPLEQFGVPQPVAQLVAYAMAKNPAVRYQSAALVAEQLAHFVDPNVLYAAPPAPLPTLENYELWIRQKQALLAAQAAKPVVAPVVVRVAGSGANPAIPMGKAASGGTPVVGPSPPTFPGPAAEVARSAPSAAEILKRKEEKQRKMLIGGLVGTGVLAIAGLVLLNVMSGEKQPRDNTSVVADASLTATNASTSAAPITNPNAVAPQSSPVVNGSTPGPAQVTSEVGFQQEMLPDDGTLLWASPTTGKPIDFRCVPPEGQLFLILRPADMIASGEGDRVLEALGPAFAAQRQVFETAAGFKLSEIEQLILTLHNNDAKFPRTSFVVKTKEAIPPDQLLARWGNPAATKDTAAKEGAATFYAGPKWAYYIANSPGAERTFLMGEARDVKDVAQSGGAPPALIRDVERLRRSTDEERHFTLLFYPPFLFNDDGGPLFSAERAKVRQPLSWLLGDHLQAATVSAHFGSDFYFEAKMLGSLDKEPYKLAEEMKQRLEEVPRALEDYVVLLTPPAYWRKLSFRYPGMIRELHGNMRIGVEGGQAIVNSVLPGAAAHNLVLGGELLVASAPGTAAVATAAPAAVGPKTIEEALALKTSYSFDVQSLEFAMAGLASEVKDAAKNAPFEFKIKIIGADLEKDGITRNQSVRDFKQEGKSIAEILTALVLKANPITTVKDPSEADQKLIWVVGPDPEDPSKKIILITTRAAAATKKYDLPAPFLPKNA